MKKILIVLLFFFALFPATALAQTTPPPTTPPTTPATNAPASEDSTATGFTLSVPQEDITDAIPTVTVNFNGLIDNNAQVCLRNDYCIKSAGEYLLDGDATKVNELLTLKGVDEDFLDTGNGGLGKFKLSDGSITVCGDGNNKLKTDCPEGKVWFHPGNFYFLTVYTKQGNKYIATARAGFYVNHTTPQVTIVPNEGLAPGVKSFQVSVSLPKIHPGGKSRNNFQVVMESGSYKGDQCITLEQDGQPVTVTFPRDNNDDKAYRETGFIQTGDYLFKVNEQTNEGGAKGAFDGCIGGFTFLHQTCTIAPEPGGKCGPQKIDPNQSDYKGLMQFLNQTAATTKLPCSNGGFVENPTDCLALDTAIGTIKTQPLPFLLNLFSIVLAIAGTGAMLLIFYAGYRLLTSRGNKDIIQAQRERITAAVIGLLFIIFSLVILSIIANDILKIPGFS